MRKFRFVQLVFAGLVAGLVGFPGISLAEEGVLELGEVVVTATKTGRLLADVPVRTEVITAEDIKTRGATNLYEALEGSPGIRVETQCSACAFTMVRMQGLKGDHTLLLIDGQPIISSLASVFGLSQIPVANIERIEIVKGAASVLYGPGAIAGVINVITRKPTDVPMMELTTQFGSYGTNLYSFAMSHAREDMDMVLTAQQHTGDAIFWDDDKLSGDDEEMSDRVRSENRGLGFKVRRHDLVGDDTLSWTGKAFHEHRRGGDKRTFDNPFAEGAEHIDTKRYETTVGYQKELGFDRKFSINLSYVSHLRDATNDTFVGDCLALDWNPDPGFVDDGHYPTSNFLSPYVADEDAYVLDVHYSFPVGDRHTLLAGIQYRRSEMEEEGMYVDPRAQDQIDAKPVNTFTLKDFAYKAKSEKSADDWGIYLQNEFRITEELELVVGARHDWHQSEDSFAGSGDVAPRVPVAVEFKAESFNPRVALAYKATEALTLRSSAGTGFRVPFSFAEEAHLCSGSPRIWRPGDLKPESSLSYNLSADYVQERYTLSASIFRTNLEDKIALAGAGTAAAALGYGFEWQNISDASTQGIELGSRILLMPDWILGLSLTYTDAQYDSKREDWIGTPYYERSKYISRVPEWTTGVNLEYVNPAGWSWTLGCDYTGEMYIDYFKDGTATEIKHTDAFWVVNTRLAKEFADAGITAFVGANNLLDEVQEDKRLDDAAFMYAPFVGRIVYAGMSVKF